MMLRIAIIAVWLCVMVIVPAALGAVPHTINYQGRLTDSGGQPVGGSKTMVFDVYNDENAGDLLWNETHVGVQLSSGLFTVILGAYTPIPDSIFDETALWLEITVAGETITPRTELTSAPYTLSAHSVHGDIYTAPGQVGIGVTDPVENLVIGKNIGARSGNRIMIGDDTPGVETGIVMGADASNRGWMLWNVDDNYFSLGTEQQGGLYGGTLTLDSGRVGINNSDPTDELHVSGNGRFEGQGGTVLEAEFTGSITNDFWGVHGKSIPGDGFGIGGVFQGGKRGVSGSVEPTGSDFYIGTYGGVFGGSGTNCAIVGNAGGGATNWSGYFYTDVYVGGTLVNKGGATCSIDHPLDPENKWLNHSLIESPDMMTVYNGNVVTDANGLSIVELPDYFEALNMDFRYQLTVIGQFSQAIVAEEIANNEFVIRTDKPNVKVSWQVTGIRKDAYADANRMQVEEDKNPNERGRYAHPKAFGLDETLQINHEHVQSLQAPAEEEK